MLYQSVTFQMGRGLCESTNRKIGKKKTQLEKFHFRSFFSLIYVFKEVMRLEKKVMTFFLRFSLPLLKKFSTVPLIFVILITDTP